MRNRQSPLHERTRVSVFENQYWLCQTALAVFSVLSTLVFLAINDFEKHLKATK